MSTSELTDYECGKMQAFNESDIDSAIFPWSARIYALATFLENRHNYDTDEQE